MVAAEHDERVIQPDLLIDEPEKIGQGAIQAQDVVFGLQAGRPNRCPM
jgi:hypothetical protein